MVRQMRDEGPALSGERDMVAARVFDAPRELVFRLWTEAEHVARWWGPAGFTTTIHELDLRPGGLWTFVMHGPDGRDYPNEMTYLEVERPERLVMDHRPSPLFVMTVEFLDRDGATEVRVRNRFETRQARDRAEAEYHAVEGLGQMLDRLGEEAASVSDTGSRLVDTGAGDDAAGPRASAAS